MRVLTVLLLAAATAQAAVETESITYREGDTELTGYLARNTAVKKPAPGILIVHDWTGLGEQAKNTARRLAELGYVAFALDMYGGGKLAKDSNQAAEWSATFKNDPALARRRFEAALNVLRAQPGVEPARIAAIGYCFGGTIVLEMARLGVDVQAVVSFHGGLASKVPEDQRRPAAAILVCHGADDPHVPQTEVKAFLDEMKAANAKFEFVQYQGAVHSFTNPEADSEGARFEPTAARRSWIAMLNFLELVFVGTPAYK
ncbi:MAG TPA: dienelactone hydrolase family protein [Candidatus Hydrogenedentes bacterium]|nr:dienelactone hydrolase family protein [Candidatus Hydrogenedentota bacterium]HQE84834.1 dienelactone hydrolase family protein [Candidatus Hydrogenedentota bacterium]HQH51020.1 dienelactone hydrolase family protein [Candidatus Hydrogenedentota bacterium]HQM48343.1 dienelactone hydrolase family protein [Candidatus Hydrogenedentota bacterium]